MFENDNLVDASTAVTTPAVDPTAAPAKAKGVKKAAAARSAATQRALEERKIRIKQSAALLEEGTAHVQNARELMIEAVSGIPDLGAAVQAYLTSEEAMQSIETRKAKEAAAGHPPKHDSIIKQVATKWVNDAVNKGARALSGPSRELLRSRVTDLTTVAENLANPGTPDQISVSLFVKKTNVEGVVVQERVTVKVPNPEKLRTEVRNVCNHVGKGNYADTDWYLAFKKADKEFSGLVGTLRKKLNAVGESVSSFSVYKALYKPANKVAVRADIDYVPAWANANPPTAYESTTITNEAFAAGLKAGTRGIGLTSLAINHSPDVVAQFFREAADSGVELPEMILIQPTCQRAGAWSEKDRTAYNTAILEYRGSVVASAPVLLYTMMKVTYEGRTYTIAAIADGQQRATTVAGTLMVAYKLTTGVTKPDANTGETKEVGVYVNSVVPEIEKMVDLYKSYRQDVHIYEPEQPLDLTEDDMMALLSPSHPEYEAVYDRIKHGVSVCESHVDRRFVSTNATGKPLAMSEVTRAYMPIALLSETVPMLSNHNVVCTLEALKLNGKVNEKLRTALFSSAEEAGHNTIARIGRGKDVEFAARIIAMIHHVHGRTDSKLTLFKDVIAKFDGLSIEQITTYTQMMSKGFDLLAANDHWIRVSNMAAKATSDTKNSAPLAAALCAWFGAYIQNIGYEDVNAFLTDIGDTRDTNDDYRQRGIDIITDLLMQASSYMGVPRQVDAEGKVVTEEVLSFGQCITSIDSITRISGLFNIFDNVMKPTLDDKAGVGVDPSKK